VSDLLAPTVSLTHGARMPVLGLGTWPFNDEEAERVVPRAIELGYRLVDTAENYGNERGVGRAVRACGLAREEVFVTTKFNARWHGRELVVQALESSLDRMGLDYVDLLLVHWPNPQQDRYVAACQGLADLLAAGRVRAIGVSNFKPTHLERVLTEAGVIPDVDQVQLSPFTSRPTAREYCTTRGVVVQAWSPLGGGGARVLDDGTVQEVAREAGCTPAQTVLAWVRQLGATAVVKSASPERMRENLDSLEVVLDERQLARLDALDQGESAAADSDEFGH